MKGYREPVALDTVLVVEAMPTHTLDTDVNQSFLRCVSPLRLQSSLNPKHLDLKALIP